MDTVQTTSPSNVYYIIHSNSFGDTLAATPTLRQLYKAHKGKINVVTHNQTVFKNNPYVNECFSFDNCVLPKNIVKYESFTYAGRADANGIEKKFSRIDTRQLHAMDLGFQLLPEEMSYDFYPDKFSLDVNLPKKYVVLHITTNWPNRTWDKENWQKVINWLSENKIFTVLIGFGYREELHNSYSDKPLEKVCPVFENLYGVDLSNQGSISDMWWVLNKSQCLVTMDSGPLHLAGCTDINIIQLGSALNPKFRAPYRQGRQDYKYFYIGGECKLFCNSNLDYNVKIWGDINHVPPQPYCLENKPTYECHPSFDNIINKLSEIFKVIKTKKEEIKFGIYTSFYNSERFIENIFKNIENLNYENFEWHITDDYSQDNTKTKLIERISKSPIAHKIIYCEQKEKKEMYWKPNLFFDDSFEWIVLVDSDDEVDINFLQVYNDVAKQNPDVCLLSSDGHKIYEENNALHSITYILNDENISSKINRYHPYCDYLNNISYSCFGLLRAFKKNCVGDFIIQDSLACAEDSYHVFWSNSFGKYLHIPRPLYKWFLRNDSESHGQVPSNFNNNFEGALYKLQNSDYGVDMQFNDVYIETCTMGSYLIGQMRGKKVSLWSRSLTAEQKTKIKLIYPDVILSFNDTNSDIHLFSLNYFTDEDLGNVLAEISDKKLLFYYQNQKTHNTNDDKDNEMNKKLDYYKNVIQQFTGISWWTYIRHFIIQN